MNRIFDSSLTGVSLLLNKSKFSRDSNPTEAGGQEPYTSVLGWAIYFAMQHKRGLRGNSVGDGFDERLI